MLLEFLSEEKTADRYGEPIAITEKDMKNIINLAKPRKTDVFYDLGSGYGELVRYVFKNTNIKKAIGIESDTKRFLISVEKSRDEFGKRDLKDIDFWCVDFNHYDFSDGTIIYNGIDELNDHASWDNDEISMYNDLFPEKTVKIIKRDFPLIGYRSVASIKPKNDSWFFLMKTPLEKYKIKSKREWLQHVFGRTGKTSSDISKLYVQHYEKRGIHSNQSDMRKFRKNFERVAKKRFEF